MISTLARDGPKAPPVSAALPLLGIAAIPVVGFWSTFRNLRCPSCNALVISQVSWNFSLFSSVASKSCASCGKKIFPDGLSGRFRRVVLIGMAVAMGLGFLGAVAGGLAAEDAKERSGGKLLSSCVGLTREAHCGSRCSDGDDACLTACRAELKQCDALRSQVR